MRIGLFTNVYKPEINGVVSSISTFRNELVRQGHNVYIFAPEAGDYEDDEYGIFRYPAVKLTVPVNYPLAIPVSPFVNWVVPRLKLDILHSQHPVLIGEEAVTFARQLELPHIFTHHSQYEEYSRYIPFNQNIVKTLTREVVRAHMVKSVRVIVPSQSICDQLAQQHTEIEDRLVVLPSPIDLTRYTPERLKPAPIRQKYELDGKFTFVSLSRITKEKNLPLLVEAFSQVVKIYQNTRLLIVGDGPVRKDLEKQAEQLGIETPLLFAGYVDPTAVPHHLAAADAFAFASTAETQGIVMAEAMAAGLPVVAVNAPGSRDVVCHEVNGLLTKNTADDLAQAMMRLVQDQALCRSLSTSALQTATSYSPSLLANQLVEIYQGAIAIYAQEPLSYKRPSRDSDNTRQFPPHWFNELTGEGVDSLSSFWQRLSSYWRMDLDD